MSDYDIGGYNVSYVTTPLSANWNWNDASVTVAPDISTDMLQIKAMSKQEQEKEMEEPVANRKGIKLIQWFIVDPTEKLPEDKMILAQGIAVIKDEREFLINLGIPKMLEEHNKVRTQVEYEVDGTDSNVKLRKLKAIKIRDLDIVLSVIKEF